MTPILQVRDLAIRLRDGSAERTIVSDLDFSIERGQMVALVGESGSGKSLTALSLLGLLPDRMAIGDHSRILLDGNDIARLSGRSRRAIRGGRIGMIFQDPFASLNPVMRIGEQVIEAIRAHSEVPSPEARTMAIALLDEVGIPEPATRVDAWPHQLSGGMRQRVMTAIALASGPDLLIADEPTTALDATIQAQVLALLDQLRRSRGLAILLISHDLGIVEGHADRVMVMHRGRIVENAPASRLFSEPANPHTRELLAAVPRMDGGPEPRPQDAASTPLVVATDLVKEFGIGKGLFARGRKVRAVDGVSIHVARGEILGLVGESGSGKSTLGRTLLMLEPPTSGSVTFGGIELGALDGEPLRALRRRMQLVFQDESGSLNPRRTVAESIAEGLIVHGLASRAEQPSRIAALMEEVGLDPALGGRRPGQLSGGQRQRVGIARALAVDPEFLVCDESVSSLDPTVQAQILALLLELGQRRGLACLFIAHDLAVVRQVADTIAVMRRGRIVETGGAAEVIETPRHPYTMELLKAARAK
ncbi:MAG TPA: ABC transporter ATP-binding protein [Gemmatimonadales bacterium]|nr:ABC transporter ATP-binding protein [Gemmatimonadales bacterium]